MLRRRTNHAPPRLLYHAGMMKDGPHIARIAALIGDHARAEVLTALMADRALTATELADIAGVSKPTISAHLAKLLDANLIAVEPQGRHRYFRLADPDVAQLLESLMGVAFRSGAVRLRGSPREPALRKARVCYDHLAGELGANGSPHWAWTRTRWPRSAAAFAAPAWTGASAATIWPAPWALPCWRVSMRWAGLGAPRQGLARGAVLRAGRICVSPVVQGFWRRATSEIGR